MSSTEEPSALERYSAVAAGGLLLLVSASLLGWGVRLAVAGIFTPAGWPPGLGKLLLPVGLTALVVGFGAWRLLRMGAKEDSGRLWVGRAVLASFVLAAAAGAVA